MDEFKKECRLCGTIINGRNFRVIGDATRTIFEQLLLKLTSGYDTQNVMCMACSSKLLAALNFKSACLCTDNSIKCYINSEDTKPVDLQEIYTKAKGSKQERKMLDQNVCRLCLHPMNSDKSIEEVPLDSIRIYIPEINFAKIRNPTICMKCHDALCVHSSFIKNCLDVEKERNRVAMDVVLTSSSIKTEYIEIKSEPVDEEMLFEIPCDIKKEEQQDVGDTSLHPQNGLVDTEDTKGMYDLEDLKQISTESTCAGHENKLAGREVPHKRDREVEANKSERVEEDELKTHQTQHENPSEVQKYTCDECGFETKYGKYLRQHQLLHRNPSELRMYKCDECDYKSIRKRNLRTHQLRHRACSEDKMYSCDVCDYKTFRKVDLNSHGLTHKDPSEVQKYTCDECEYVTKYKSNLKKHQIIHKDPSQVKVYTCDKCDYQSIVKGNLSQHLRIHKNTSEVRMYRCDACGFETKHKSSLKEHQLAHRNPSEVQKYTCDVCDYKSFRKGHLRSHRLKHQDSSELQMFRCHECEYMNKYKCNLKKHLSTHKHPSQV